MQRSENINELAAALCEFQGTVAPIPKTKTVNYGKFPHQRSYTYAELSDILKIIKDKMKQNGLSHVEVITDTHLSVMIIHTSGQWIKSMVSIGRGSMQNAIQDFGSQITYLRRYLLCALLGIASEEDDDSQSQAENECIVEHKKDVPTVPRLTPEMNQKIRSCLMKINDPDIEKNMLFAFTKEYPELNIKKLEDIPAAQGDRILKRLQEGSAPDA